jgi:putative DNA primase/helicase
VLAEPAPVVGILASTTGWRPDFEAFVLPPGRILAAGAPPLGLFVEQPSHGIACAQAIGSFPGWRREVGQPARYSSRLVFSLCAGLTPVLLAHIRHDSFGFNLYGPSSSGKTTGLKLTRTLVGPVVPSAMLSGNMTPAAFQEAAAQHNDLPLLIDELAAAGTMAPTGASAGPNAYVMAGGAGKRRHSSWVSSRADGLQLWRTIVQTTDEQPLPNQRQGAAVRLINLSALANGRETIVDCFPKGLAAIERRAFARNLLTKLNQAAFRHAGHALPAFVQHLIPQRDTLPATVEDLVEAFSGSVGAATDSMLGARLARAFGLVYAAGILAVRAGIFPWPESKVGWAVRRCFRAARAEMPDDRVLEREGRKRLWKMVKEHAVRWPTPADYTQVAAAESFRKPRRTDVEYAIVPAALFRWLPDKRQRDLVLESLERDGILIKAGANQTSQPKVLGPNDRRRYYRLRRPLKSRWPTVAKPSHRQPKQP